MAKRERVYKIGGPDPRTGTERAAAMLNKAMARPALKKQNRQWDDTPERRATNIRKAAESKAWEEHQRTGK